MEALERVRDLSDYVNLHPEWVTIREDASTEDQEYVALYVDNTYSLVANEERMFIVGDMCFKVFDDGIIVASIDDMTFVQGITEIYVKNLGEDNRYTISVTHENDKGKATCQPNYNDEDQPNSAGNNRTKIVHENSQVTIQHATQSNQWTYQKRIKTSGLVRAQKKTLNVWFNAKRTTSAHIQYQVKYTVEGETDYINVNSILPAKMAYSRSVSKPKTLVPNVSATNIAFVWINSTGSTPHATVTQVCD